MFCQIRDTIDRFGPVRLRDVYKRTDLAGLGIQSPDEPTL